MIMVVCNGNGDAGTMFWTMLVAFAKHLKNHRKYLTLIFIWHNSNSISVHLPKMVYSVMTMCFSYSFSFFFLSFSLSRFLALKIRFFINHHDPTRNRRKSKNNDAVLVNWVEQLGGWSYQEKYYACAQEKLH